MTDVSNLTLVSSIGDGKSTACLMSARSLLDGRGLTDEHPSAVIRKFGIAINDASWWSSNDERTAVLLPVALDERMCGSKVDASLEAEQLRAYALADWAIRELVPDTFNTVAKALAPKFADHSVILMKQAIAIRGIAPVVDEASARGARDAANVAVNAANAANVAVNAAVNAANAAANVAVNAAYAANAAANVAVNAAYAAAYAAKAAAYAANAANAARKAIRNRAIAKLLELCEIRAKPKRAIGNVAFGHWVI